MTSNATAYIERALEANHASSMRVEVEDNERELPAIARKDPKFGRISQISTI